MLTAYPHVDLSSGVAFVAGTRVPVRRLWHWHSKGITFATLVKRYPTLKPAWILSALAFGYDNVPLLEAEFEKERAAEDALHEMKQLELPCLRRRK